MEAEKEYKKAIALDPEDASAHNNLGVLYHDQKKYVEAEKEYKKAIALDPEHERAINNLKVVQEIIKNEG